MEHPALANAPPCPLTGRPPLRLVQVFSTRLLVNLWRIAGGVDVSALYHDCDRIELYESPVGLFYFHPMRAGGGDFYERFYRRIKAHEYLEFDVMRRVEFLFAASFVPEGAAVLDVGCGRGSFRHHVRHARYAGVDPFAPADADGAVARHTLDAHAGLHPGQYDVATAFQVIEHVSNPRLVVELMLRTLRPGGLLILAVPLHPSPLTEIPNFIVNAPPHHLTWWSERALRGLCDALSLEPLALRLLEPSPHAAVVHWMRRLSLARTPTGPERALLRASLVVARQHAGGVPSRPRRHRTPRHAARLPAAGRGSGRAKVGEGRRRWLVRLVTTRPDKRRQSPCAGRFL